MFFLFHSSLFPFPFYSFLSSSLCHPSFPHFLLFPILLPCLPFILTLPIAPYTFLSSPHPLLTLILLCSFLSPYPSLQFSTLTFPSSTSPSCPLPHYHRSPSHSSSFSSPSCFPFLSPTLSMINNNRSFPQQMNSPNCDSAPYERRKKAMQWGGERANPQMHVRLIFDVLYIPLSTLGDSYLRGVTCGCLSLESSNKRRIGETR